MIETVEPKFHTPRNYDRPTLGTRQSVWGRVWLNRTLMPWQQRLADVAGELLPDGTPAYGLIVGTLQRQSGKSDLEMVQTGERCFSVPGYRAWYTAQTGGDARDQFLKFDEDVIRREGGTPLAGVVRTLRGNGHELMKFPNGSQIRPHPPTEAALHGKQSDRNGIDEAWAFAKAQGEAIMQAISPTQLTRPHAQTFVWSAGGTAASTWLAELVARGRAGDPAICYVEYGIPDDLDVNDLDAVARHHPAYGHTITTAAIRKLRAQIPDDAAFARAAGNRWTEIIGGAIPGHVWESVRAADPIPDDVPVGFGVARADDGSMVAIAVAAELRDGSIVVEILECLPTAYGAIEHVLGWADGETIAIARGGADAGLADELVRSGRRGVLTLTTTEAAAGVSTLLDALPPRRYRFRRHPALDAAVAVAATRTQGDGGKAWAHSRDGASIAPLRAATMAAWAVTHREIQIPTPTLRVPGERLPA